MGQARRAPLMSINATPRTNAVLPAPFLAAHNSVLAELYVQAKASRWSLSREEFSAALYRSVAYRFGALLPRDYTVEFYLRSLHLEDFAFACALHRGTAWAWEQFFGHYRPPLYSDSAAMAGTQGEVYARKLVDALYDELHPIGPGGDEPDRSGLRDYHGRSKLTTWLRVLIAERHVDSSARRQVCDTEPERRIKKPAGLLRSSRHFRKIRQPLARFDPLRAPYLAALRQAFDDAIAALAPSDCFFAALYYAEQLDRSQMAQLRGVPEITISRHLADIRLELHDAISGILASTIASNRAQQEDGVACALTPAQIERCFTYAFEDWQSEIHAPSAKPSLWEAKISVLRDLPLRRDKKSGGKESSKERDEVFAWLLANSLKRRAANISASNAPGCPDAELLSAYADRALDPDETARWELHFADCVRCRAILAAYMAPAKQPAAQRETVSSGSASVHAIAPGANIAQVVVPAAATLPPAADPRPNRSARLASQFAWRWIAPVVMLAIGGAIGFALHPLSPQVTSRFPQRVEPDDYAAQDDSQSAGTLSGPFGSPGPATSTYETGTGSDADGSATASNSERESNWQKNRFVQIASRELMKAFTQTEKLFDWLTVPPSTLARAARGRPANQSARTANSSFSRAASRAPSRPASRAEASPLGSALPVVFASPDAKALWRIGPAGRIAYSADRGAHWQIQASGVDADLFAGVATSDHAVWVLGRGGVILRTTDGTQWRTVSNPSSFSSRAASGARAGAPPEWIRIAAADKLHATVTAADSRKFLTSNGGATWVAGP